jgi:hypothetical protein
MDNKIIETAIEQILNTSDFIHRCDRFYRVFKKSLTKNKCCFMDKNHCSFRSILDNNIDSFLFSVTGYGIGEMLKQALLMHNDIDQFYNEIIDGTYISILKGGMSIHKDCKVNTRTFEVFDFEPVLEDYDNLDGIYVEIDGFRFPVYPSIEINDDNIIDFWFNV